jgi:hypothetical protein
MRIRCLKEGRIVYESWEENDSTVNYRYIEDEPIVLTSDEKHVAFSLSRGFTCKNGEWHIPKDK